MAQAVIELEQDYEPELVAGKPRKAQTKARAAAQAALTREEEIWLLGLPPLGRYLEFVEEDGVEGADADRAALIDEWRAANDYYQELERSETGIANQVGRTELDPALSSLAARMKAHPRYRRTFNSLPTSFGMVELDRLIVYQKHVSRNFVDSLKTRIGPAPDAAALFRFCLPLGKTDAPVRIRRVGSRRYVFSCESTDFRFHEPALLRPDQANGYESFGEIAGIVGLVVGFGSNFLNVISVGKRLLLNNGYHRACALRAMGITHAPCIIQTATRAYELGVVVKRDVAENAEFYFESARPPLLKDFFDPRIRKVLPVRKRVRQIEVNFEVKDYLIPE
jgi:hypothetical protein